MPIDLAFSLPMLVPRAIAWAEAQSQLVLRHGASPKPPALARARSVGVVNPNQIRVRVVDRLPLPDDPLLQAAAIQTGLLGPNMVGLTLGYAVLVCRGHEENPRLLSHEFRHVHQYEAAGSIASFLPAYLQQIVAHGYTDAPTEIDARAHERDGV